MLTFFFLQHVIKADTFVTTPKVGWKSPLPCLVSEILKFENQFSPAYRPTWFTCYHKVYLKVECCGKLFSHAAGIVSQKALSMHIELTKEGENIASAAVFFSQG